MKTPKRVIFTCGGTAGHVNPALALAQYMREQTPDTELLFVGAERGLEKDLVPQAGYPFRTVHISSFHRSFKPAELRHNLISAGNLLRAPGEARAILREFRPDVVVGTGGYASYPMIKAAARAGLPTAVHESNMVPGMTTQMLEKYAGCIMVGFEECRTHYRRPDRVRVTGTPVRGDFFRLSGAEAKKKLGMDDGRPLLVSFWGSLGAAGMNREMESFLFLESKHQPFYHIHGAGGAGLSNIQAGLRTRNVDLAQCPAIQLREYIYDMAVVMRAADLVLCRAGASTISELTALGVPAVIVPSPYVTNNHQEKNARVLERAGGAAVLLESEATGQRMFQTCCGILRDEARRTAMASAMEKLGVPDATERIYQAILSLPERG